MKSIVKKLKVAVKDDSLEKYGTIRLKLNAGTANAGLQSSGTSIIRVVSGDVQLQNYSNGIAISLPYVIPDNGAWITLVVGEGGAEVEIENKYELKSIKVIEKLLPHTDVKTCSYLSLITDLNSANNPSESSTRGFIGDLANIIGYESLTSLYWRSAKCTGNIAECGRMLNLTKLYLYGGSVYGSLESLVAAYRENGKTSGQLEFDWMPKSITFNGVSAILKASSTLAWTASTITWNGTTINA